jgi:hypothetical protein
MYNSFSTNKSTCTKRNNSCGRRTLNRTSSTNMNNGSRSMNVNRTSSTNMNNGSRSMNVNRTSSTYLATGNENNEEIVLDSSDVNNCQNVAGLKVSSQCHAPTDEMCDTLEVPETVTLNGVTRRVLCYKRVRYNRERWVEAVLEEANCQATWGPFRDEGCVGGLPTISNVESYDWISPEQYYRNF